MPIRVELIDDAVTDLAGLAESGLLPLFLKKLLRLEEEGNSAGLPLGRGLTNWRKRQCLPLGSANPRREAWADL